jgi:hypothetical protein
MRTANGIISDDSEQSDLAKYEGYDSEELDKSIEIEDEVDSKPITTRGTGTVQSIFD